MSSSVSKNGQLKFFVRGCDEISSPLLNSSSPEELPNGSKSKKRPFTGLLVIRHVPNDGGGELVEGGVRLSVGMMGAEVVTAKKVTSLYFSSCIAKFRKLYCFDRL